MKPLVEDLSPFSKHFEEVEMDHLMEAADASPLDKLRWISEMEEAFAYARKLGYFDDDDALRDEERLQANNGLK